MPIKYFRDRFSSPYFVVSSRDANEIIDSNWVQAVQRRKKIGRNSIAWIESGPGGHGAEPSDPSDVESSLAGCFSFTDGEPGLRSPQMGALHALVANSTLESTGTVSIVMPTGTGKTETMLAAYAHAPSRTLVVVPTDALRSQTVSKFASFGVLNEIGVLTGDYLAPVVGVMKSRLDTADEAEELLSYANVIVATASALNRCGPAAFEVLASSCGQLWIDEAHHVPAKTWSSITGRFGKSRIVQFTATPFREDGKVVPGKVIYAYPLRLAQSNGYFSTINYRSIPAIGDVDRKLAVAAIDQLRHDLSRGRDHILMARTKSIARSAAIQEIYAESASDLASVVVHSRMSARDRGAAFSALDRRDARIIICVDMLGEGFDLPALKIAAIHDPHKSLGVTLQFAGRFARTGGANLGEASVFVPRQLGRSDPRLRRLYAEDADWNHLVRDLSETEVQKEAQRAEFESQFGSLPEELAIRAIQPKMSTVVYRSPKLEWNPEAIHDLFDESQLLTKTIAVNSSERVVWFVTEESNSVEWGEVDALSDTTHHLFLVHCDLETGLMYVHSSDKSGVHQDVAQAVGGAEVEIIKGDVVYRVLDGIERRVPRNVGLLDAVSRNRRFTMHVGADVLEGFGPTAAQKSKTNIFAHGYLGGARASFGAARKGRIWSHRAAHSIKEWLDWARYVGKKLTDETIEITSVMGGFIVPKEATSRPPLVPLGVEWPFELIATTSESRGIEFDGFRVPLIDTEMTIVDPSKESPILFEVRSDHWTVQYSIAFGETGPLISATDSDAEILSRNRREPLSEYLSRSGVTVWFEQEAVLSPDGYLIQPDRGRPRFEPGRLEPIDWEGINLRKESQGTERDPTSVQFRVIESLRGEGEWTVVLDDDGPGEAADAVFLRIVEKSLEMMLVHCKYSSSDTPGSRIEDLYAVCGQAVKSYKARSEVETILHKIWRREAARQSRGHSGLVHGSEEDLFQIIERAPGLDSQVTVVVAQPGLSRTAMSHQQAELLACTELYLNETYGSKFRVLCSA